jgi:hypothetical protein
MRALPAKPEKTLADTLAIAVSPVLLIILLGSLMLFLVEVGYRGPHAAQVRWTLTWFILATVLVSRISIERGSSYGSFYGLMLGIATAFRLTQFLGVHVGALVLLGILWWCASKLTWDCTVIDDDTDASGEGLLQRAQLDRAERRYEPNSESTSTIEPTVPIHHVAPAHGRSAKQQPHAPGLWVVYFSLAALPLFGLGQLALPADAESARFRAFLFLWTYLAAALGLLLITSFLGLRRYLRQRRLVMPGEVVKSWMIVGSTLTLIVLFGSLWLPRPEGADTLANLLAQIRPATQQTSPHERWSGDTGEDRHWTDSADPESEPTDDDEPPRDPSRESGERGRAPAQDVQRQEQRDGSGEDSPSDSQSTPSSESQSPELVAPQTDLVSWLRWIMFAIGVVVMLILLIRFGRLWLKALRRARPKRAKPPAPAVQRERPVRSFASYVNPFRTGRALSMTGEELTVYTFDALQAWARERRCGRRQDQTPVEFGQTLAGHVPDLSDEVLGTVRLYVRVAYGKDAVMQLSTDVLERLWIGFSRFDEPGRNETDTVGRNPPGIQNARR